MPLDFKIAQSYLDTVRGEDEERVFNPRDASDGDFKEFMVFLFLNQRASNAELRKLVSDQADEIAGLRTTITELTRDNNQAHLDKDQSITELKQEIADLRADLQTERDNVSTINTKQKLLYDRSIDQERYSRGFNLRMPGVPECITKEDRQREDCISKVKEKFAQVGLGDVVIENAHRVGPMTADPDKPRQIIMKFLYRPEKKQVWRKRKQLWDLNIKIFEDLCKHDLDIKMKYAKEIQAKFDNGAKVWFSGGFYYVNGVKQTHMQ